MDRKTEILNRGEHIFLTEKPYTGPNNRRYAKSSDFRVGKYILAEQRFITNHDDIAEFVEIIDAEERVIQSWKFDVPMVKWFCDPNYFEDDCLILFLRETYGLPVVGWRMPG